MSTNWEPKPADFPQFYRPNSPLTMRQQNRRWVLAGAAIGTALVTVIALAVLRFA